MLETQSRADVQFLLQQLSNIVEKSKQLVVNSLQFQNGTFSQTKQQALDFLHFRFTFLVVCNNEPKKTHETRRVRVRPESLVKHSWREEKRLNHSWRVADEYDVKKSRWQGACLYRLDVIFFSFV